MGNISTPKLMTFKPLKSSKHLTVNRAAIISGERLERPG